MEYLLLMVAKWALGCVSGYGWYAVLHECRRDRAADRPHRRVWRDRGRP